VKWLKNIKHQCDKHCVFPKTLEILILWSKRNWVIVMLWLVVVGIYFTPWGKDIWQALDPFYTMSAAFAAITLMVIGARRDWENSLPKKMHAKFYFKNMLIMHAKNVEVTGEADLRQWGQQLGAQMGKGRLGLEPHFLVQSLPVTKRKGAFIKPYEITFFLTKLPECVVESFKKSEQFKAKVTALEQDAGEMNSDESKRKFDHSKLEFDDTMIDSIQAHIYSDEKTCPYMIDGETIAERVEEECGLAACKQPVETGCFEWLETFIARVKNKVFRTQ